MNRIHFSYRSNTEKAHSLRCFSTRSFAVASNTLLYLYFCNLGRSNVHDTIDASKNHPLLASFGSRRKKCFQALHFYKRLHILRSDDFLWQILFNVIYLSFLARNIITVQTWEINTKLNKATISLLWLFYFFFYSIMYNINALNYFLFFCSSRYKLCKSKIIYFI